MRATYAPRVQYDLDAFDEALASQDAAPATRSGYMRDARLFFDWYLELEPNKRPATSVKAADLSAWRRHLVDVKRLAGSTVNRKLQAVRRFFRQAEEAGWRSDNPARKVRMVRTGRRLQPRYLDAKEVNALLRAAGVSRGGARNYALVQLGLQAGLRVGEIERLVGDDLVVRQRSGEVRVRDGKGHRERVVPLNSVVRRALTRYFDERGRPDADESVFRSERGTPMAKRTMQYAVRALAKRAGILRLEVGVHTLRHTFAMRYLSDNPSDLVGLAQLLGHESLDTTAVYVRPSRADLADRVEGQA